MYLWERALSSGMLTVRPIIHAIEECRRRWRGEEEEEREGEGGEWMEYKVLGFKDYQSLPNPGQSIIQGIWQSTTPKMLGRTG